MSFQSRFLVAYLEREFDKLDRVPPPMPLTRAERQALFAGQTPKLAFPGSEPCPVEPGHIEVLSANVEVRVTGIRRTSKGEHALIYVLKNDRIGQRFLAVQDGQLHPEQYAHSGGSGVDSEGGEAVDDFTQKRLTRDARDREQQEIGDLIAAMEDVRSALDERVRARPEAAKIIGRELWQLRGRIDAAKSRLKRRMAA